MEPAIQLLQCNSSFPVFRDYPAEILTSGNSNLTSRSIVIMPSLSGTTKESVAMLDRLKEIGAQVITLIGHADTPLGFGGNPALVNFADDDTSSESFYIQALLIALSVMKARAQIDDYDVVLAEMQGLPEALLATKRAFSRRLTTLPASLPGPTIICSPLRGTCGQPPITTRPVFWKKCSGSAHAPVHAADFFHGPLELIDKGVSLILMRGEDGAGTLADRVASFAPQYTDHFTVLDTADFVPEGTSPLARAVVPGLYGDDTGAALGASGSDAQSSAGHAPLLQACRILRCRMGA